MDLNLDVRELGFRPRERGRGRRGFLDREENAGEEERGGGDKEGGRALISVEAEPGKARLSPPDAPT
jgi:hypothetical protein